MTPRGWRERPPVDKGFQINIGTKADLGALRQTTAQINQTTQAQRDLNAAARGYAPPKVAAPAPAAPRAAGQQPSFLGSVGEGFTQFLPSAGALGFAAVIASAVSQVRALVEKAKEIKEFTTQLDVTVSEFKSLSRVAAESGNSLMTYAATLTALRQARRAAAEGDRDMRETFERFGVTLKDLNDPGLRALDLLKRIGASAHDLSELDRNRLHDLLGRGSDRVAASLAGLGSKTNKEFDEAVEGVAKFGRAWDRMLKDGSNGLMLMLGGLTQVVSKAGDFWRGVPENQDRAPQVARVQFELYRRNEAKRAADLEQVAAGNQQGEQMATQRANEARAGGDNLGAFEMDNNATRLREAAAQATAAAQAARRNAALAFEDWQQLPAEQRTSARGRSEERSAMFDDKVLAKAQLELDEKRRKLAFDMLTDEQKKTYLVGEQKRLSELIAAEADPLNKVKEQADLADVQAQLFQLNNKPGEAPGALPANAWERLGASFGAGGGAADMTRSLQQQTARNTQQIAQLAGQQVEALRFLQNSWR